MIAWNKIGAKIEAKQGNIGRVRVVGTASGSPAPIGIKGDILAEKGRIGSILTTAAIDNGDPVPLKIIAGNGIGEILTIDDDGINLVAADVNANIVAHKLMVEDPDDLAYQTDADGALRTLVVNGDLRGEIHVGNLSGGQDALGDQGIFVYNICYAPITVDYLVDNSNIIARTFTEPIRVGRAVMGAIVATGGATPPSEPPAGYRDGYIPSIVIGDVTDAEIPEHLRTYPDYADCYVRGRGLIGQFARVAVEAHSSPESWFPDDPTNSGVVGALDACVQASGRIGYVNIASLTNQTNQLSPDGCTKYSPVVESPEIGYLHIDDLAAGTVWSGSRSTATDPQSVYSAVDEVSVGCLRRMGTLRVKDWSSFVVEHNSFGDIHVPKIDEGDVIWIGGAFGDERISDYESYAPFGSLCHCAVNSLNVCDHCLFEDNYYRIYADGGYRNPTNPGHELCGTPDPDDRGQIWLHDSGELRGQIVINGNALSEVLLPKHLRWTGVVQIGELAPVSPALVGCPALSIVHDGIEPWVAPTYDGDPLVLIKGDIGTVPFALHDIACDPENPEVGQSPVPVIVDSYFNGDPENFPGPSEDDPYLRNSVKLEFYGPVVVGPGNPLVVWYHPRGEDPVDVTDFFLVTHAATAPRLLELTRDATTTGALSVGNYSIEPGALYCGEVTGLVPVEDFTYRFAIGADCNQDGMRDVRQIELDPTLDLLPDDGHGHVGNGWLDECETCPWQDADPDGCPADYDQNGGIDGSDLALFFTDYEAGLPCSDIDQNGGTDGTDLATFFTLYEAGGC